MPLPSSGRISLANIQAEFGGTNPIRMSEYYAGGSYVAGGTIGYPGGVPTSIPVSPNSISIKGFYGASSGATTTTTAGPATTTTTAGPATTTTTAGPATTTTTAGPATTTTTQSGTVSLSAIDAQNYVFSQNSVLLSDPDYAPSNVYLRFFSNGAFDVRNINGTTMTTGNWRTPISANVGQNYWINWVTTNVSITAGADIAANSAGYLTLADAGVSNVPSQQIYASTPGNDIGSASATYWIRISSDSGGSTVLASANVTLEASTIYNSS